MENERKSGEYYRQCHDLYDDRPSFPIAPKARYQVARVGTILGNYGHG
ncbi:MAG: hypothetical protein QF605_09885 [Rhodospirillales bacterium]|nr:hypothetical protein [Rhodospirillales bacterium]